VQAAPESTAGVVLLVSWHQRPPARPEQQLAGLVRSSSDTLSSAAVDAQLMAVPGGTPSELLAAQGLNSMAWLAAPAWYTLTWRGPACGPERGVRAPEQGCQVPVAAWEPSATPRAVHDHAGTGTAGGARPPGVRGPAWVITGAWPAACAQHMPNGCNPAGRSNQALSLTSANAVSLSGLRRGTLVSR
jgi:hypothetical protein